MAKILLDLTDLFEKPPHTLTIRGMDREFSYEIEHGMSNTFQSPNGEIFVIDLKVMFRPSLDELHGEPSQQP